MPNHNGYLSLFQTCALCVVIICMFMLTLSNVFRIESHFRTERLTAHPLEQNTHHAVNDTRYRARSPQQNVFHFAPVTTFPVRHTEHFHSINRERGSLINFGDRRKSWHAV